MTLKFIPLLTTVLLMSSLCAQAETITVDHFSQHTLGDWEEKSFAGHTEYTLIQDLGHTVLKAHTSDAASGMFRKIDIDLNKTPYLNWSWKVESTFTGNNEQTKAGDDYPARIYVVVSGGLFFWKTRAINYVWSSNQAIGTQWDNAYTHNAKMIAVRSGDSETGQWLTQKRNIREDLKQLFGEKIDEINAIAIMSDSDNTHQSATAYYGDIFFSSK